MREIKKIDFTKLLGFETVSEQVSEGLDFQDETISAKLGAKVGNPDASLFKPCKGTALKAN